MIGTIAPGSTFEAWTDAFATGLTGTLGARIRTAAGASFLARTTTGITEDVTKVYKKSFTAPTTAGDYVLVWDDTTTFKAESFVVSFSSPTTVSATGRDLCSLTDVTALTPGYAAGDDPDTDAILQTLITEQSRDAMERTRREIVAITSGSSARKFDMSMAQMRRRKLPIGDAASITGVALLDGAGNLAQTLTETTDYVLLPRTREDWQPYSTVWFVNATPMGWPTYWWGAPGTVQVTATWGYPLVPATVKDAVARLTLLRYLNDTAAAGTALADALNRADLNLSSWWRQALDALDRHAVPSV